MNLPIPDGSPARDALERRAGVLGTALAIWGTRDDGKPQPEVRQAANTAMDEIDAMLADLHRARAALADEIHASDDAGAARVDAMLADRRAAAKAASR